jgi:hypothetical protein
VGQKIPFVPADELEIVREVLRRVSQGERFVGIERRRLRKDGSLIDLSVSVAPMYDEAGTFTGIVASWRTSPPQGGRSGAFGQRLDLRGNGRRLLASASRNKRWKASARKSAFLGCGVFHCIADETKGCLHLNATRGILAAEAKNQGSITGRRFAAALPGKATGLLPSTSRPEATPAPIWSSLAAFRPTLVIRWLSRAGWGPCLRRPEPEQIFR